MRPLEASDRGLIVAYRGFSGLVWLSDQARFLTLPVVDADVALAGDVAIDWEMPLFAGLVVRARATRWLRRDGLAHQGAATPALLARVAAAIARHGADLAVQRRGTAHRKERRWPARTGSDGHAQERCVAL